MKKKVKNSVLTFSAVLAAVMIFALALPFSASAETFSADIGTQTDILDMEIGHFKSRASGEFGMTEIQLTDGVIAADDTTRVFWNAKAVADRNASAVYEKEGGDYIYKLTDGTEKAYFYVVEFTDLRADVDSFAIYFNTDAKQDKAEDRYPSEYIDSSFDILVSSDGGKTFSVAWSSVPLTLTADGTGVDKMAGLTEFEKGGGNTKEEKITNSAGEVLDTYRYIEADFDKKYEKVDTVVYACSALRRNTYEDIAPHWWACRMSEFDVYGEKLPEETTPEATTAEVTTAGEDTGATSTAGSGDGTSAPSVDVTSSSPQSTTAAESGSDKGCASFGASAAAALIAAVAAGVIIPGSKKNRA